MKNSKLLLIVSILLLCSAFASAQIRYDVRFVLNSIDCDTRLACWDVQIRSGSSSETSSFGLGDQNYRMFWDSELMTFVSSTSSIVSNGYTTASNKNTSENVDGSAQNQFSFRDNFGFHEYAISWTKGANRMNISDWATTSQVCFNVLSTVDLGNPNSCVEIIWGREGVTDEHTNAFVQMSYIDNSDLLTPASLEIADDLTPADGDDACFHTSCPDVIPSISISNTAVDEDDGTATIEVCLSSRSKETVSVDYSTSNGTAISGSDYTALSSQTLNFVPGDSCKTVTVNITDDSLDEGDENLFVDLSNANNANLSNTRGAITIRDNDVTPVLPNISVGSATVTEGQTATVQVCLNAISTNPVTFSFATSNNSASNDDYTSVNQSFTIPAGNLCVNVNIPTSNDANTEETENFTVRISNVSGANTSDPDGIVTINNNDSATTCNAQAPSITIGNN